MDCGDVEKVIEQGWNVLGVLLTHAHCDHIYGLNKLIESFPDVAVYSNADGKVALQDPRLNFSHYHEDVADFVLSKPDNVRVVGEGTVIPLFDGENALVLETPGHDPSCISFRIGNRLFTGDAYIPGVKVVTSFPRSNRILAKESLERIMTLEKDGLEILSGHEKLKG